MDVDALCVVFHHAQADLAVAAAAVFLNLMPDERDVLLTFKRQRQAPDFDMPCPVFVNFINLVHHNLNILPPLCAVRRSTPLFPAPTPKPICLYLLVLNNSKIQTV